MREVEMDAMKRAKVLSALGDRTAAVQGRSLAVELHLTVVAPIEYAGQVFVVGPSGGLVGGRSMHDVSIQDSLRSISRNHARISFVDEPRPSRVSISEPCFLLEDLGSANGTTARFRGSQVKVMPHTPFRLLDGQIITFGKEFELGIRIYGIDNLSSCSGLTLPAGLPGGTPTTAGSASTPSGFGPMRDSLGLNRDSLAVPDSSRSSFELGVGSNETVVPVSVAIRTSPREVVAATTARVGEGCGHGELVQAARLSAGAVFAGASRGNVWFENDDGGLEPVGDVGDAAGFWQRGVGLVVLVVPE
ncbi:uncharacterized protein AMSG_02300 [Thecamonas trahens ATCC 50062]|uniref:FHA domain-containing protein n=1 Tax=Thecamonas trahens ATCC 50062 TaxID=461836 RepID=A0A0L0DVT0_THETB|nr:hypothetical protein AMSG_02300 [Thecamonas trahens ATCC 50062]KNC56330.1 hypothetical protein AMSG_02300 [Thecamonas trahens ATCC 50062]|eukprot:XP_013760847.1 hypothetical protein AMSG_02300 [Thecamonas trahens ATCC 50062]